MYFLKFLAFVLASVFYVECFRVVKRSPQTLVASSSTSIRSGITQDKSFCAACGVKSGGGSDGGSSDGDRGKGDGDGGEYGGEGDGEYMYADESSEEEDGMKDNDSFIESQVINGEAASEIWPWMASIVRGTHGCGGSVIDQRHIITAAHCFDKGNNPDEFTIHVGELHHGESGKTYEVESIQIHEEYSPEPDFSNDIAMITLKEPLPDDVVPICLPEGDNIADGDKLSVIGFGGMQEGGLPTEELQEVHDLTVVSTEACDSKLQEFDRNHTGVSDKQICTVEEDEEKGFCQGDSGGALMQDNGGTWTLIGIVSYSVGCSRPGIPSVYIKVAAYQDWINQHIGE